MAANIVSPVRGYDDSLNDELGGKVLRPLSCTDMLFSTFNMDSDYSLVFMFQFAYTNCIQILALEDQLTRASADQKIMIQKAISVINEFTNPLLMAFRLAPFVFTNTRLRERLNASMLESQENQSDFSVK
jgi:hypothetical protein